MPSFAELEQHVDRALADLPALTAPGTLLPRVLAAVQAWAGRPWYQRAWLTWPVGLQVASAALLLLLVALLSGCGFFGDVTESVDGLYDRDPRFDQGSARAYAAPVAPAAAVAPVTRRLRPPYPASR